MSGPVTPDLCVALLKVFADAQDCDSVTRLFNWMRSVERHTDTCHQDGGISTELFSDEVYSTLFQVCSSIKAPRLANTIQQHWEKTCEGTPRAFVNFLPVLNMHISTGNIYEAFVLFEKFRKNSPEKITITEWNFLISAFCKNGDLNTVEIIFNNMKNAGILPDADTYNNLLVAATLSGSIEFGEKVMKQIRSDNLDMPTHLVVTMVEMYARCSDFKSAEKKLAKFFPQKKTIPIAVWNALLKSCLSEFRVKKAMKLFEQIQKYTKPNNQTYILLLDYFAIRKDTQNGEIIEKAMKMDPEVSQESVASLLNFYGQSVGFAAITNIVSDFQSKENIGVDLWNTILRICAEHNKTEEATNYLVEMQLQGVKLTKDTYMALIALASNTKSLEVGEKVHKFLKNSEIPLTEELVFALMNMYGRCGIVQEAEKLFYAFDGPYSKTLTGAMISIYNLNGEDSKALALGDSCHSCYE